MSPLTSLYYSYTSASTKSFALVILTRLPLHFPALRRVRRAVTKMAYAVAAPFQHFLFSFRVLMVQRARTILHRSAAAASFSACASAQTRDTLLPRTYTCFSQAASDTPPSFAVHPSTGVISAYSCTPPALLHSLRIYSYLVLHVTPALRRLIFVKMVKRV